MRLTPLARAVAVALAGITLQFVMVTAFAWPAARLAPRHVPIVVAGPAAQATALASQITSTHPGAFDIVREPGLAAARQDLLTRRAYGAIVLGVPAAPAGTAPQAPAGTAVPAPGGTASRAASGPAPMVMTASAASPAIAQLLTQIASQMSGAKPPVVDVVPTSPNDPHGAVFGSLLLPLVITSIIAGALITLLLGSAGQRLTGLILFAAGGGALTAATAHDWLSALPGNYLALAGAIGLIALAAAAAVAGLGSMAGRAGRAAAGIGLGALIMLVIGNPLSGATSAPELLPAPWGQIGQWLPPGAGSTTLRAVAYFNGAAAGGSWAVLTAWTIGGLALIVLAALLTARRTSDQPQGPAGGRQAAGSQAETSRTSTEPRAA